MITDAELSTARAVRTVYGWFRVIKVEAGHVVVNGDFLDLRIPRSTILEAK